MVYSGMGPDYRLLIRRARKMAQVVQCSCTLKSELLRSFAQCRTTTLCIMRRSPRRSWCTGWLLLCKSTPSQAGYEILTMFWLRYYHRITFSTFVTIITRWGLSECLSWFAAGMSPESHCFSRLNWKSGLCNIHPAYIFAIIVWFPHFQCDPSGAYFAWKATAMGKNSVNGKTFLEKR